jgi:ABC-2 type transport system permease protein
MGISLLALSLYLAMGLIVLASFSLFGLLDLSLLLYLLIFFLIAFFTIGSLMMAVGSAVNDMREAQSLMMPLMMTMIVPWILWMPIVRDPNSTLALVVSFVPPLSSFGMLLRLASSSPPPAWQVWLSIAIGIAGVFACVWFTAKVFRIGVLMFGKPPDLKTLIKWVRAA